jgi:hypothetical protein
VNWTISYFNEQVRKEISDWPVGLYADFLRLVSMMEEHGGFAPAALAGHGPRTL